MGGAWRAVLLRLLHGGERLTPDLTFYHARPPGSPRWPEDLQPSPTLREFYELCDGGQFSVCRWLPLAEALQATKDLVDPDEEFGTDITWGRHLVFGVDELPCLYVWDAAGDIVLTADDSGRFGGEAWPRLGEFLDQLFVGFAERGVGAGWAEAIKRVSAEPDSVLSSGDS